MRTTQPDRAQERRPQAGSRETAATRRGALGAFGLGAATLAVLGAAGVTGRAVTGGVFATGTGPAYDAWGPAPSESGPSSLVLAAILAANAHNAQPWIFTVGPDRIDVHADLARTLGAMDPALRELHVSLGCAVENLVQAGPPHALSPEVTLLPDAKDPTHVATVSLTSAAEARSPLFDAIKDRHTDRNAYDTARTIGAGDLAALSALVDVLDTRLVWFTTDAEKRAFADLTVRATQAIIDDADQARDDFAWYRGSWADVQSHRDGITIDPSGQSALIRAVAKLVPTSQAQDNAGWLSGTRDTQLPTAAAFGALVVAQAVDPRRCLEIGRIWQRLHLTTTVMGLSVQPLCQIPERIDRETTAGLPPTITDDAARLFPPGLQPVMTFRIGYPTTQALLSPRRPVADVVRRATA